MLFIPGCRKPLPVLSLFPSGQRKWLYWNLSQHCYPQDFIPARFQCLVTLPRNKGKNIPQMTVSMQRGEGKAVCFLWPCVIQIHDYSFLLSEDKLKKSIHFPLLQALVSTSAKPSKELVLKEILQQTANPDHKRPVCEDIITKAACGQIPYDLDKIDLQESQFFQTHFLL